MKTQVAIIGAGISGLSAAIQLKSAGIDFKILESEHEVGGRVRSKNIDGYVIDRGFQVLLTAYPEAKNLLDYEKLNLKTFDSGAMILHESGKKSKLGDPLRQISSLFPTLFSGVGSLQDKMKILRLSGLVKSQSIETIFNQEEQSTLARLQSFGFSQKIIDQFFKPFFSGIFLEQELKTSSRMFDFVFKMFSQGVAALPQKGMQEIPLQLWEKVGKEHVLLNRNVQSIEKGTVHCKNGESISADHILLASEPNHLIPEAVNINRSYVSTTNVHFVSKDSIYPEALIALNSSKSKLVNNICQIDNISEGYSSSQHLISTTIVGDKTPDNLEKALKKEVSKWFPSSENWELLDVQKIDYALPTQQSVQYDAKIERLENLWFTGDYLSNGSLNASMRNGRKMSEEIIKTINS